MNKILNYIDNGVIICDLNQEILFVNTAILSKLNFSFEELCGINISKITSNDEIISKLDEYRLDVHRDKTIRVNLYAKDNTEVMFNVTLGKDLWQGKEILFLVLKEVICEVEYTKADLEKILDMIPYSLWVKDIEGKYVYINKKHAEVIGKEKSSILLHNDFNIWNEEDSEHFRTIDQEIIKYEKPILEQHKVKDVKNEESWFETYKAPILNYYGEVKYVMGISRDITLSKSIEQELDRSYRDMMTLNSIIPTSEYDGENAFESIKADLISRLKPDGGTIWIYEKVTSELKPLISFGISEDIVKNLPKVVLLDEQVLCNLENAVEGVLPIGERDYIEIGMDELKANDIKYSGMYKIRCNNDIIGIINILYKDNNNFDIKSDDFIKTICNQLGMIIKNDMLSKDIKCELQKRKEAEEELQMFLNTAVDLISVVDSNKKFKRVNAGWTSILGWTEQELLSMDNATEILFPEDVELTSEIVDELKTKLSVRGAINRYIAKNGEVHWIEWSSRYIPKKGISICTGRDITKLKNSEEQREVYKKALEMEKVKSEFFANISHEFKTPLNIILTAIQLIMKNVDENQWEVTPKVKKYLKSVKQNSYRLLKLVNNLIDISKIDAGYYEISLENKNIISVVEDITMSVAEYMKHKGIELIFDTDEEEVIIACDPDKIERIMLNLLSNSVKYSKVEGHIKVEIQVQESEIMISVADDGIGIEKEKLQEIFARFSQVKNTLTRECEGSGIGLSLVKSLVEMHDGIINVESKVGVGTKFEVKLPIKSIGVDPIIESTDIISSKVEKCSIEFSDIYR